MSFFSDLAQRARALFFRGEMERELDEEVRTHLEYEVSDQRRAGLSTTAARRQALVAFGGVEKWKEETRSARGVDSLEGFGLDLKHSLRSLRRNPGFTLAVIGVLGLGLGAATTVFSVVRTVLFSQLPYPNAERLVRVYQQNSPVNRFGLAQVDVQAIAEQQKSFEVFGYGSSMEAAMSGVGTPERVGVGRVNSSWFAVLGLSAQTGRLISPEDESAAAPPVTVVTHSLAERLLGGPTAALGKSLTLDGITHTIVGVLPPGYDNVAGVNAVAWAPLKLQAPARRGPFRFRGIGRLKEGVTLEAAAADLAGVSARLFPVWASSFRDQQAKLTPYSLRRTIVGDSGQGMALFGGAVALVLLIAIANVATLMLVRASAREQELAVRSALGASRSRLARLLLTESVLLTLMAGGAGLLLTLATLSALVNRGAGIPRLAEIGMDGATVGFGLGAALISGILISLSPISALLSRPARERRASGARAGIDHRSSRLRTALVVGEFALALPLLLGAGLLLNSFLRLSKVDPGFNPQGVVTVNLSLPLARYSDPVAQLTFWTQAENQAATIPGTRAVGYSTAMPPDDPGDINNFDLLDKPVPDGTSEPVAPWSTVTSGFFTAMGIPLLEGRLFSATDTGSSPPVVVVSRSWAAKYYPGESPVGKQLYAGGCRTCPPSTVIGVVGDVKYLGLSGSAEAVYDPVPQAGPNTLNLVMRSSMPGDGAVAPLVSTIRSLDGELPLSPSLMTERLKSSLADPGRWMAIVAGFALAAALLAALGIYGLMSYVVRQRQKEIGVRIALGAEPASVTRMIMLRGMSHAVIGSAAGIVLALFAAKWVRALLYQVSPFDPLTIVAVALLITAAALLSCWIPGRRAARVDLPTALRSGE